MIAADLRDAEQVARTVDQQRPHRSDSPVGPAGEVVYDAFMPLSAAARQLVDRAHGMRTTVRRRSEEISGFVEYDCVARAESIVAAGEIIQHFFAAGRQFEDDAATVTRANAARAAGDRRAVEVA